MCSAAGPDRRETSGHDSGRRARASGHVSPRTFGQRAAPGRAGVRGLTMNAISSRLSAAAGAYFVVSAFTGPLDRADGGLMVIVSGLVALLVFLAFLQRLLSSIGGARSSWPAMTSFGLIFLAMQASELAYFGVEFQASAPGANADLLTDVIEATFVASTIFFGLFVLSAATATHAQRLLPAWLTWPGLAVGAVTALAGALGVLSV